VQKSGFELLRIIQPSSAINHDRVLQHAEIQIVSEDANRIRGSL